MLLACPQAAALAKPKVSASTRAELGRSRSGCRPCAPHGMLPGRTSTAVLPANALPTPARPARSRNGRPLDYRSRALRLSIPNAHARGATDIELHALRYYGCLVVDLYNKSRPHMALGPGVPDPPRKSAVLWPQQSRHRIGEGLVVLAKSVLGGLHHEYSLAPAVT